MAVGAGVRRAEGHGQVGPRDPERMVVPPVDDHVGARRHVAGHAVGPARRGCVPGVLPGGEADGVVALAADGGALGAQASGVRIVAVPARHAAGEHEALAEGVVVEDLVLHLAVVLEQVGRQHGRQVGVAERVAGRPGRPHLPAARVAHPARLHFAGGDRRSARHGPAGDGIGRPVAGGAAGLGGGEALVGDPGVAPPGRPRDMAARRAVAGFAADADLGPRGAERVGRRVVALRQRRRMAFGAHVVPRLLGPRPVAAVGGWDRFTAIDVEPALAALLARAGVPRPWQDLQASVRKRRDVLLQGLDAEGVGDGESRRLAVAALRLHEEALAVRRKRAREPPMSADAPEKSPRTLRGDAAAMAFAWCEDVHAVNCASWHPAQARDPAWSAGAEAASRPTSSQSRAEASVPRAPGAATRRTRAATSAAAAAPASATSVPRGAAVPEAGAFKDTLLRAPWRRKSTRSRRARRRFAGSRPPKPRACRVIPLRQGFPACGRAGAPSVAAARACSSFWMSVGLNLGRSTLIVSLFSVAVNGKGGL